MLSKTLMQLKGASLASKTLLRGTIVSVLILISTMALFFFVDAANRRRDLQQKLEGELESVQVFVGESYLLGDFVSIRRYLDSYAKLNSWIQGRFVDQDGNPIWTLESSEGLTSSVPFSGEIRSSHGGRLGTLTLIKDTAPITREGSAQRNRALAGILFIGLLGLFIQNASLFKILRPISDLTDELRAEATSLGLHLEFQNGKDEILHIKKWFTQITQSWRDEKEIAAQQSHFRGMAELASQVAHDIRSPISSMNFILSTLTSAPEEKRILIRAAIHRINDIANDLLSKSKGPSKEKSKEASLHRNTPRLEMLSAAVDELVSEKRLQIREKINVNLEVDLSRSYGSFVSMNVSELKRALSNLINNAIEAVEQKTEGSVLVQVVLTDHASVIKIKDNGVGIPAEILPHIGQREFTHGKEFLEDGGHGLGVYHAKKTIEAANGAFEIESTLGKGTTITISLPRVKAPKWFLEALWLKPQQTIVICDDDSSIHDLWKQRFETLSEALRPLVYHCSGSDQFLQWKKDHPDLEQVQYLMDYELLGSPLNGLDLIAEFNLGAQAILVTSRHEERAVLERCEVLAAKLLPKGVAALVPLKALLVGPPAK